MQKFKITYGIGGGYNVVHKEIIESPSQEEALDDAYTLAAELFETYGVFEEQNPDYDQNSEYYEADWLEELERWIICDVEVV